MSPELQITLLDKPDDTAWEVIGGGISTFNLHHTGIFFLPSSTRKSLRCKIICG